MANYSTNFLKTDWSGAGLDLEFGLVTDAEIPVASIPQLVESLLQDLRLCCWHAVSAAGGQESGSDTAGLQRVLRMGDRDVVLLDVEFTDSPYGRLYVHIAPPYEITIGAPAESFFSGSSESDSSFVGRALNLVDEVKAFTGPVAGAFAFSGIASQMAREKKLSGDLGFGSDALAEVMGTLQELRRADYGCVEP